MSEPLGSAGSCCSCWRAPGTGAWADLAPLCQAERSGTESRWKPRYKADHWVQVQSNAIDTMMVEMCWRAPSTVTQLGSLIKRPQLAAALQAGSGIRLQPEPDHPEPVPPCLGLGSLHPSRHHLCCSLLKEEGGNIPPHFHALLASRWYLPIPATCSHPRRAPRHPRGGRTWFWDAPRLRSQ